MSLGNRLRGWVRLEAEGCEPERLLNLATEAQIPLWNVSFHDCRMTAMCPARYYRKFRPLARRTGSRIRVREKGGLPFKARRYRRRVGLLGGLILYLLLLELMSARIWMIEIRGNEQLTDEQIGQALESLGVYPGADFSQWDIPLLQTQALQTLPQLTWMTVNVHGSIAYVEVRERDTHVPIAPNTPSNLKAMRDGVIVRVEVADGQATVKPGEAVTKGTLLISGVVDTSVGPILKRASGKVIARTEREWRVEVPLRKTELVPTGETVYRSYFLLLGMEIPLFSSGKWLTESYDNTEMTKWLEADGLSLPAGFRCTRYRLLEEREIVLTEEQAAARAYEQIAAWEQELSKRADILQTSYTDVNENGCYTVIGRYVCEEDITMEEQILTDKNQ